MATVIEPRGTGNWQETDRRVRHPLQAVRGYIRTFVLLEGLGYALLYLTLAFWLGLALDWGLFQLFALDWVQEVQELTTGGEFWLRLALVSTVAAGFVFVVVSKTVVRLFREFSDPAMALLLERRFPRELGDRVITAVELADPKLARKYGYSLDMVQKTIREAAERVERLPVRDVFNWGRLKRLFALFLGLSLGLYLLVGITVCSIDAAEGAGFNPFSFMGRFSDTSAIWFERNVLLRDSYWPRRAYLELIGFQDTPEHPGEMRAGRDEQRPDLQVRAIEWVVADHRVQGGWRPLLWNDLPTFLSGQLLGRVNIPADWPNWIIDLDDLKGRNPGSSIPPESWQGLTSGAVREQIAQQADLRRKLESAGLTQAVHDVLDWRTWTVDHLSVQMKNDKVRLALRASNFDASSAIETILSELAERAADPAMARRLRRLEIPAKVHLRYRGKTIRNSATFEVQDGNKSLIGLADIKESVVFTVQALDYFTPNRKITLVPPPGLTKILIDKEEPAYIYFRAQGDQDQLKGLKRVIRNKPISLTGDVSIVQVPLGTNLVLRADVETDRPLKSVYVAGPDKALEFGSVVPDAQVLLDPAGTSFSLKLDKVAKFYEFFFEYRDRDNVKGRRHILVRPTDDRAPEILDVEIEAVFRKPRFRSETGKVGSFGPAGDAFLITPDALIPIKGTIQDDYGLTKVQWVYDVEQVEIELQGDMPVSRLKSSPRLRGKQMERRFGLLASAWQFAPLQGEFALVGPAYWSWMSRMLSADLALGNAELEGERTKMLPSFENRLRNRAEAKPLAEIKAKLNEEGPLPGLLRKHSWKYRAGGDEDADSFDLQALLPKLKSADPLVQAQLHYFVRISLSAADNNVETGPGVSKSKTPFLFLVVSSTELLAQIALEETILSDRLEKAYDNLKRAKIILADQISKLSQPDPRYAEMAIRIDQASKGITDAFGTTREVLSDYKRIQEELELNRVAGNKIFTVANNIVAPLDTITDPARDGDFPRLEDAVQKLHDQLEDDAQAMARDDKTLENSRQTRIDSMRKSHRAVDELMTKLNAVMIVTQEEVSFAKTLESVILLERLQRRLAEQWDLILRERITKDLENLIK